jgi:hypothetical protein
MPAAAAANAPAREFRAQAKAKASAKAKAKAKAKGRAAAAKPKARAKAQPRRQRAAAKAQARPQPELRLALAAPIPLRDVDNRYAIQLNELPRTILRPCSLPAVATSSMSLEGTDQTVATITLLPTQCWWCRHSKRWYDTELRFPRLVQTTVGKSLQFDVVKRPADEQFAKMSQMPKRPRQSLIWQTEPVVANHDESPNMEPVVVKHDESSNW